ncbi:MAG: cell division protein FtsX, partial [bacterium]
MYSLKIAIKSLMREKWINLLTSLTIGLALLVLSVTVFSVYNLGAIAKKLPEKFTVMVYLKDGLTDADIEKMKVQLQGERLVQSATYISKEKAFKELKDTLRGAAFVLEGL